MTSDAEHFFTAPWDPVPIRRGDALGLRGFTDELAETLAPNLTNRVVDARWVTILSWCLVRSHNAYHAADNRVVATRAQQDERYAWLRPLELMWVARTIQLTDPLKETLPLGLSGQRSVRRWIEGKCRAPYFGMSPDQYRAYRQTGMYGGYRVALRSWPNMTVDGDGWTPDHAVKKLADYLDKALGRARPEWGLHDLVTRRNTRNRQLEHDRWWLRRWSSYTERGRRFRDTLPQRVGPYAYLPEKEAELLQPLIFGIDNNGKRRQLVANEIGRASAHDHLGVCEHLGKTFADYPLIHLLPHFARLADAGMDVMDEVAQMLVVEGQTKLEPLISGRKMRRLCQELYRAARAWKGARGARVGHIETVNRFAEAVDQSHPKDGLKGLLEHHERSGGGLRWFVLRDGSIEPRAPLQGNSSRYRFRLWPLARLATQCRILPHMPKGLRDEYEAGEAREGD